jgi:hypothetical protein
MTAHGPDQARKLRYLLGTLPEEEAERLEREFLGDDASHEDLLALEDELFHDYARGALADGDRQHFEARFLQTSEGRRRLAEARGVQEALGGRPSPARVVKQPAWPLLAAAAAVLMALAVAWVARGPEVVRQARSSPAPLPSAGPTAQPSPRAPRAGIVTLALAAGVTRGDSASRQATLSDTDGTLRLVLSLPAGAPGAPYTAAIRSAEDAPVWTGDGAPVPEGAAVAVEVPASVLPEGDYEIVLSGTSGGRPREAAAYAFRILRP